MPLWSCLMPFGLPVRSTCVKTLREQVEPHCGFPLFNALSSSSVCSNLLAAILLPYDV